MITQRATDVFLASCIRIQICTSDVLWSNGNIHPLWFNPTTTPWNRHHGPLARFAIVVARRLAHGNAIVGVSPPSSMEDCILPRLRYNSTTTVPHQGDILVGVKGLPMNQNTYGWELAFSTKTINGSSFSWTADVFIVLDTTVQSWLGCTFTVTPSTPVSVLQIPNNTGTYSAHHRQCDGML